MDWKSSKGKIIICLILLGLFLPLVGKFIGRKSKSFGSRIEAAEASNQWIKEGGTSKVSYQSSDFYTVKEANPNYQKAISRKEEAKNKYNQKVSKCNSIKSQSYVNYWKERRQDIATDNYLTNILFGQRKSYLASNSLEDAQSKDDKSTKSQRKRCLASTYDLSELIKIPSETNNISKSRTITKQKDVLNRICEHENDLRQFVCHDNRKDNSYRYFRY